MKFKNKILPLLLAAAMVFMLTPVSTLTVLAASDTYHIDYGYITIEQNTDSSKLDVTHSATSGATPTIDTIPATDNIVITQTNSSIPASNYIYIGHSIPKVNITLNNVNIDESAKTNVNALYIATGTTVNLTLTGDNTLKSGYNSAGIGVPAGTVLTVTAASTGSLTVTGGESGAGIGGGNIGNGGVVTINDGTVTAIGGFYSAGIGGGLSDDIDLGGGNGGTVTVTGGTVTATGKDGGAGIGGGVGYGFSVGNGNLYISGGSIDANVPFDVYQSLAQTTKVYKTTVKGLPKSRAVTCSVNGGDKFSCKTDTNGYLYLWLPSGASEALVNDGDKYFKAKGSIAEDNSNVLTAEVYVAVVTDNTPVPEAIPQPKSSTATSSTPASEPAPEPKIGDTTGWTKLEGKILKAKPGETITIDMNGTTKIPQSILSDIKGKDVNLVLDFGTYSWTINGNDVTFASSIDLGVEYGTKNIDADLIDNLIGEHSSIQLSLNYNGGFGFTGTLMVKLPSDDAGNYANLFYHNPETNTLEFQTSGIIDKNGNAQLKFSHASDYVIVIDNVPMVKEISAGAGIEDGANYNEYPHKYSFPLVSDTTVYPLDFLN